MFQGCLKERLGGCGALSFFSHIFGRDAVVDVDVDVYVDVYVAVDRKKSCHGK